MLKNYFVIAVRNLLKHKSFSFINVAGLSLGIACCLLLTLYIQDEMSYDKHHVGKENLYRIVTRIEGETGLKPLGTCSPPIAMAMRDEIPEVETAARLLNPPGLTHNLIRFETNMFYESEGYLGDSTLFDVLTFTFLEGSPQTALVEPNSVVIAETLARKLFGNESALNKVINITQGTPAADFRITGVYKDVSKSLVAPNFIVSMTSSGWAAYLRSAEAAGEWAGQNFVPSYLRLRPGHSVDEVTAKMNKVLEKYGAADMKALGFTKTLLLEPLQDVYLKSDIDRSARSTYVYIIGSIAAFILLLGCINFMNLSTAKAAKRASEIGIRKVMGAFRGSIIRQLLGEAMVLVAIAIVLSVVMVQLALPYFNDLTGKNISFNGQNVAFVSVALLTLTLVTGVLAGSYPAFYLSSFQPAQVLKGKLAGTASGFLRQSLVVFQFMIAITLVCGMFVITKQLRFMENKNLGFNPEAKIVLPMRTPNAQQNYSTLKSELAKLPNVQSVSATSYLPGSFVWNDMLFYKEGGSMDNATLHRIVHVDHGYLELLGIPVIAGRSYTDNRETESDRKIIINRTSAKEFGFTPEEAIGRPLSFEWQGNKMSFEIVGVIEDFHQISLKEKIYPLVIQMAAPDQRLSFAVVNVRTDDLNSVMTALEGKWKQLITDTPFEYSFLDENIQKQYHEDKKMSQIITSFTAIAMLISCLGLYGLSTYMAERRFKEIGVRKVMGASIAQIVRLMSGEFVKLVIIAFAIAVPIAWYGMAKWLDGFAYKISIDIMIFVYAGAIALVIALITVSFESIRAASVNPVNSLRSE